MAITVNRATLARQVNGEIEYIYPKTYADLVEYDSTQNIKDKIDSIIAGIESIENKVDKPIDDEGNISNGTSGQVLETNGDGTTSWVTRARIYVGSDEMPEGYDIKIDPDKINTDIDATLSTEGAAADAKAVGNAIATINETIESTSSNNEALFDTKVDKPFDENGSTINGTYGQVLESNGDGTTSWVNRARVYVGSDEMPEGYDVQIDPDADAIEIDRTLSVDGGIAEASAVGAAINNTKNKITADIETHNTDAAAHIDIRAMITEAKDYILLKDSVTGEEYKVTVENGVLKCTSTVVRPISINVTTMPTKTSYGVGETFDPTGMVATVNYDDDSSKVVDTYTYHTTPLTAGTTEVVITYVEAGVTVTTSVAIEVVVECIGINVTTQPTKTQYYIGDTFSPAGMIVAATYTDGTVKAVTNYTYPTTALTKDVSTIAITYVEDGTTFTTNVIISVIAKYTGITVTTNPTKTQYTEGQMFDPTGMVITASYNDGTTKTVTGYTYPMSALKLGTTSVAITYIENGLVYTANVAITVIAAFDAVNILQDFTYVANDDGTYTITGWKGTKNGVTSTEMVIPDSKYVVVNPSV